MGNSGSFRAERECFEKFDRAVQGAKVTRLWQWWSHHHVIPSAEAFLVSLASGMRKRMLYRRICGRLGGFLYRFSVYVL